MDSVRRVVEGMRRPVVAVAPNIVVAVVVIVVIGRRLVLPLGFVEIEIIARKKNV